MTAATTGQPQLRAACYELIDRLDFALVIPLAFIASASGVLIGVATKWHLLRHWWVLVKLVLTAAVVVFSTFGVGVWVEQSITATGTDPGQRSPAAAPLIGGAAANMAAFVFMIWVSIAKPCSPVTQSRRSAAMGSCVTGRLAGPQRAAPTAVTRYFCHARWLSTRFAA